MRYLPSVPVGLKDQNLIRFLTELLKVLQPFPNLQCYTQTAVWTVPYTLSVPTGFGQPRPTPPLTVKLGRALVVDNPTTVVNWGSTTWVWKGNDTVQILDQAGLVEGVQYQLTFEVIG